ncbi:MAG: GreA/GreB family elongation factor [Spirochaetia bacterium]|nr:GreA/GreB family elongation factor [Spirochaetia bacterium]
MSRAFIGDDQYDAADDESPEIKIPIPAGSRNYVTPEGAALLAEELGRLETETRSSLTIEIERLVKGGQEATELLSNTRRALGRVNRRIEYLSVMASLATTVETPAQGYDTVRFGATVTIMEGSTQSTYRIVGIDEADSQQGRIGWTSPIARALIGKRPGDNAVATLPEGERHITIVSIS